MKGIILDYSAENNSGVIHGDDQHSYEFSSHDWNGSASPLKGQQVDFEISSNGATDIYLIGERRVEVEKEVPATKNKFVSVLRGLFSGGH